MDANRNLLAYADTKIQGLSKSESVVTLLLKRFPENKIPEAKVIEYYKRHIQRCDSKFTGNIIRDYTKKEIRLQALNWFYRGVGKLISRNLITTYATIIIDKK